MKYSWLCMDMMGLWSFGHGFLHKQCLQHIAWGSRGLGCARLWVDCRQQGHWNKSHHWSYGITSESDAAPLWRRLTRPVRILWSEDLSKLINSNTMMLQSLIRTCTIAQSDVQVLGSARNCRHWIIHRKLCRTSKIDTPPWHRLL